VIGTRKVHDVRAEKSVMGDSAMLGESCKSCGIRFLRVIDAFTLRSTVMAAGELRRLLPRLFVRLSAIEKPCTIIITSMLYIG